MLFSLKASIIEAHKYNTQETALNYIIGHVMYTPINMTLEEGIKKIYNMPSRRAISSGAMETVPDRSVFLKYLIKNLKRNGSKFLLSEQLFVKMKPGVINNSPTNQAPLTGVIQQAGDEGGDFIFLRRN